MSSSPQPIRSTRRPKRQSALSSIEDLAERLEEHASLRLPIQCERCERRFGVIAPRADLDGMTVEGSSRMPARSVGRAGFPSDQARLVRSRPHMLHEYVLTPSGPSHRFICSCGKKSTLLDHTLALRFLRSAATSKTAVRV